MNSHYATFSLDVDNLDGVDGETDTVTDIVTGALRSAGYKGYLSLNTYGPLGAAEPAPTAATAEPRVVAYRNPDRPDVLLCRTHGEDWAGMEPVTSEELPDGGICTWGRPGTNECGVDVLAATEAPAAEPYCTGDACLDCGPAAECCETMCGVCPRVSAHNGCTLRVGDVVDTRSCHQHGMRDINRY